MLNLSLTDYSDTDMCEDNPKKVRQRKRLIKRDSIFESLNRDPTNIHVKCFRSISEIGEHLWDNVHQQQDFFHSYKFLLCIEKSRIENCQLWYLLFYRGEKVIGSAVLSLFEIRLDLFAGKTLQKVSYVFREVFPNFLKINVLFCGLPISIGKNTLSIINSIYYKEILNSLVGQMQIIALEHKINYLCLKEFREDETIWLDVLGQLDFIKINKIGRAHV